MAKKIRSDIKIGNLEKKLGLDSGAIRNPDGSDARSDKRLGTLQKDYTNVQKSLTVKKTKVTPSKSTTTRSKAITNKKKTSSIRKKALSTGSPDQKKAALRTVKANPKTSSKMSKIVSAAIKKTTKNGSA